MLKCKTYKTDSTKRLFPLHREDKCSLWKEEDPNRVWNAAGTDTDLHLSVMISQDEEGGGVYLPSRHKLHCHVVVNEERHAWRKAGEAERVDGHGQGVGTECGQPLPRAA